MARTPRVAAHLGRPETPTEERARKAENTKNYRQSKTFTNLIFALVVTLAIVAAIYFIVPRGELDAAPRPDVESIASDVSAQLDRPTIVPVVPEDWGLNIAELEAGNPGVWTVNYNDVPSDNRAFIRFAQAFDSGDTWASQTLSGTAPTGTVTVDGIEWSEYQIGDPDQARNISYALGAQAGSDHILIYGTADADTMAVVAAGIADSVLSLRDEVD